MTAKETYQGDKPKKVIYTQMELLKLVMYGNRNTGEVDQAYEELKQAIIESQKDLAKLEELKRDVKRFMELNNALEMNVIEGNQYDELRVKLSKVGREE